MEALITIGIILLVIILVLLIRVGLHIEYNGEFIFTVSVAGIKAYDSRKPKKEPREAKKTEKTEETYEKQEKKENFLLKFYREKGLSVTVKMVTTAVKEALTQALWLAKRLKIRNFCMSLSVTGDDAADTAIKYGGVCAAVYPVLTFIDSSLNFKAKKIDVSADFDGKQPQFSIAMDVKSEIIILLAVAVKCYCKYKQIKEVYFNERKQH